MTTVSTYLCLSGLLLSTDAHFAHINSSTTHTGSEGFPRVLNVLGKHLDSDLSNKQHSSYRRTVNKHIQKDKKRRYRSLSRLMIKRSKRDDSEMDVLGRYHEILLQDYLHRNYNLTEFTTKWGILAKGLDLLKKNVTLSKKKLKALEKNISHFILMGDDLTENKTRSHAQLIDTERTMKVLLENASRALPYLERKILDEAEGVGGVVEEINDIHNILNRQKAYLEARDEMEAKTHHAVDHKIAQKDLSPFAEHSLTSLNRNAEFVDMIEQYIKSSKNRMAKVPNIETLADTFPTLDDPELLQADRLIDAAIHHRVKRQIVDPDTYEDLVPRKIVNDENANYNYRYIDIHDDNPIYRIAVNDPDFAADESDIHNLMSSNDQKPLENPLATSRLGPDLSKVRKIRPLINLYLTKHSEEQFRKQLSSLEADRQENDLRKTLTKLANLKHKIEQRAKAFYSNGGKPWARKKSAEMKALIRQTNEAFRATRAEVMRQDYEQQAEELERSQNVALGMEGAVNSRVFDEMQMLKARLDDLKEAAKYRKILNPHKKRLHRKINKALRNYLKKYGKYKKKKYKHYIKAVKKDRKFRGKMLKKQMRLLAKQIRQAGTSGDIEARRLKMLALQQQIEDLSQPNGVLDLPTEHLPENVYKADTYNRLGRPLSRYRASRYYDPSNDPIYDQALDPESYAFDEY